MSCDPDENCPCDFDDEDCDETICVRDDESDDNDAASFLVDCFYLYGDREEEDAEDRTPSWSEVDGGDRSPFYDACEDYVLCDLVTQSGGRDDYYLGCSECAANHYPAVDVSFDQTTKPECMGLMSDLDTLLPTFCYPLDVNVLGNLDFDDYCPNNNVHQVNVCNYFMGGGWTKISREYGGASDSNPFVGCARTSFCSFDADDMVYERRAKQCACAE